MKRRGKKNQNTFKFQNQYQLLCYPSAVAIQFVKSFQLNQLVWIQSSNLVLELELVLVRMH